MTPVLPPFVCPDKVLFRNPASGRGRAAAAARICTDPRVFYMLLVVVAERELLEDQELLVEPREEEGGEDDDTEDGEPRAV